MNDRLLDAIAMFDNLPTSGKAKTSRLNAQAKKELAATIAQQLAEIGIYAMYGGAKGHGFWLYRGTNADALATIRAGDGFSLLGMDNANLYCIKNNGKASCNESFWMFSDAEGVLREMNQVWQ